MPLRASQLVSTQLARTLRSSAYATSATHTGSKVNYDVVIVGGGPAGLALASALAASPHTKGQLDVAIVEAGDLSKIRGWQMPEDAYSNRVSSLTNVSEDFLKNAGIWRHIAQERTCPIEDMQVWDGISDARIDFSAQKLGIGASSSTGAQYMSRMTENVNLQRAALRHLDEHPSIHILDKTMVETISNDEEGAAWPLVHLSTGQVLRARLLVGADGFNSPVRAFSGIKSYGWAYPTHAIVATLRHSPRLMGYNTTAYQRFLPTGPIAFLPLSPTVSSLVWSTRPALAAALTKADSSVLVHMVNAAFRLPDVSMRYLHDKITEAAESGLPLHADVLRQEIAWRESSHQIARHSSLASATVDLSAANDGVPTVDADLFPPLIHSVQTGTAASFPLRFSHCETYLGEGKGARTVLVGDAAHTIHPLAGQGLNGGLSDVECLARCIQSAISTGGDIGSYTALQPYARERYIQNHSVLSTIDKLHKLYASQLTPVVWSRSSGVEVLNELDVLKAAVMLGAGTERGPSHAGTVGWNMFASGLEIIGTGARVARALGGGLRGVAGNMLRQTAEGSHRHRA